jgi:hypothetical protein
MIDARGKMAGGIQRGNGRGGECAVGVEGRPRAAVQWDRRCRPEFERRLWYKRNGTRSMCDCGRRSRTQAVGALGQMVQARQHACLSSHTRLDARIQLHSVKRAHPRRALRPIVCRCLRLVSDWALVIAVDSGTWRGLDGTVLRWSYGVSRCRPTKTQLTIRVRPAQAISTFIIGWTYASGKEWHRGRVECCTPRHE